MVVLSKELGRRGAGCLSLAAHDAGAHLSLEPLPPSRQCSSTCHIAQAALFSRVQGYTGSALLASGCFLL